MPDEVPARRPPRWEPEPAPTPGPLPPGYPPPRYPPPGYPPPPAGRARRRRTGLVVGLVLAAVVLVVAVVVLVVALPATREDVLDARAVEQGVSGVVTTDWRRTVADVRCPSDQPVRVGTAFRCTAVVDGRPQEVPVRVVDDTGTYQVGQPR